MSNTPIAQQTLCLDFLNGVAIQSAQRGLSRCMHPLIAKTRLLQISGAKVRLHEAPREAPKTVASQAHVERQLDISGASGQVQAAMKLVQAFLLAGNVEPLNIYNSSFL